MKHVSLVIISLLGLSLPAHADVWMWIDAAGNRHFVDTQSPIYTWVDSNGEVYYSDTPEHENALSVRLQWYSSGTLQDAEEANADDGRLPGESEEEQREREQAEAYYCDQATEVYESYVDAPHVFRTTESGKREYLSKKEKEKVIADALAQKEDFCQ